MPDFAPRFVIPNSLPQTPEDHRANLIAIERAINGFGTVMPYPVTWIGSITQPVIGNGTLSGLFALIGGLCWVNITILPGSTTTFGSGIYSLSLPAVARLGIHQTLEGDLLDTGTQHYDVTATIVGGVAAVDEILQMSNAAGPANWAATVPFTFGNGDAFVLNGVYAI